MKRRGEFGGRNGRRNSILLIGSRGRIVDRNIFDIVDAVASLSQREVLVDSASWAPSSPQ